jgi:hypothetical protein
MKSFNLLIIFLLCCYQIEAQNNGIRNDTDLNIEHTLKSLSEDQVWELIEKKSDWFKSECTIVKDSNQPNENFQKFFNKFNVDSVFQINNIDYKIFIGAIGECEETIILTKNNWEFGSWDYTSEINQDGWEVRVYQSPDKFYFEGIITEVGLIYKAGFEIIEGNWKMTLVFINNC